MTNPLANTLPFDTFGIDTNTLLGPIELVAGADGNSTHMPEGGRGWCEAPIATGATQPGSITEPRICADCVRSRLPWLLDLHRALDAARTQPAGLRRICALLEVPRVMENRFVIGTEPTIMQAVANAARSYIRSQLTDPRIVGDIEDQFTAMVTAICDQATSLGLAADTHAEVETFTHLPGTPTLVHYRHDEALRVPLAATWFDHLASTGPYPGPGMRLLVVEDNAARYARWLAQAPGHQAATEIPSAIDAPSRTHRELIGRFLRKGTVRDFHEACDIAAAVLA